MKPKPFSALNHFTVPCATCAPTFVRTAPLDRGAGVSLFRPSNTNVELEPRGTVQEQVSQVTGLSCGSLGSVVGPEGPPVRRSGRPRGATSATAARGARGPRPAAADPGS